MPPHSSPPSAPLVLRSYGARLRRLRHLGCPPDLLNFAPPHFHTLSTAYVCSKRATERKFQGMKWPGSESARERIGQGPVGRFAPGSELAFERKGSVPVQLRQTPSLYLFPGLYLRPGFYSRKYGKSTYEIGCG